MKARITVDSLVPNTRQTGNLSHVSTWERFNMVLQFDG